MAASILQTILFLLSTFLTNLISPTYAAPAISFDTTSYPSASIIKRDIAILGGGSSGTYAAIALRDHNKTVAVFEKQNYLGGHTNTYTDPASGKKVDYGVVEFDNTDTVKNYFARFDIPLTVVNTSVFSAGLKEYYIDFRTGKNVAGYMPADPSAAFGTYGAQLAKYPYLAAPGYKLPSPVPSDLLLPFGDFTKKYNIDDAVFAINEYAQGFGNLLEIPSLYVLKYFGQSVLGGAQSGFLTTARGNNGELYEKAGEELGDHVFLNSTVLATSRSNSGVKLVIQTPQGLKLVIASKLIISAPPLLSNLAGFDVSTQERTLFQQWVTGAYYTSLVSDTGIPDDVDITNVGADTAFNLPPVPAPYGIDPTLIPGLKDIKFGSTTPLDSNAAVQSSILASIQRIKTAGTITNTTTSNPNFVAFNSHTPYELRVSSDAIKGGFYGKLNALQGAKGVGGKSTWYTGAAFDRHDSGDLWAFTEGVVGGIVGA